MSHTDGCPCGRSQFLSLAPREMVSLDRQTLEKVLELIVQCIRAIKNARHCEIFLTSLNHSLCEWSELELANEDEITKLQLLLNYWLDVVPDSLEEVEDWLGESTQTLQTIFAASRLGGRND